MQPYNRNETYTQIHKQDDNNNNKSNNFALSALLLSLSLSLSLSSYATEKDRQIHTQDKPL